MSLAAPLTKVFRYRDTTGRPASFHADHWRGFEWEAGPVIVAAVGPWGTMQVWAISESEGRRVIAHAAAAAGLNLSGSDGAEWIVTAPNDPRYGRTGRVRTWESPRGLKVSKRDGPRGQVESGL